MKAVPRGETTPGATHFESRRVRGARCFRSTRRTWTKLWMLKLTNGPNLYLRTKIRACRIEPHLVEEDHRAQSDR